jgi:hypothetical protein
MKLEAMTPQRGRLAVALAGGLVLGGCTVMPVAPSVMALPGSTKTVEQYQSDSVACQQRAQAAVAAYGAPTAAYADNQAANVAAGSAVYGAATGALIGAATGQGGQGAAIGAGIGLLFGGLAGSSYTNVSSYQLQRGYDRAYLDCMYASGNKVPEFRGYAAGPSHPSYSRYPPPNQPPPPGVEGRGYAPPGVESRGYAPPGADSRGYGPPADVPPSSYPPRDAPPPPTR